MAEITQQGHVKIACPSKVCSRAISTYEYRSDGKEHGAIVHTYEVRSSGPYQRSSRSIQFRLFRCAGCGRGGIGEIKCSEISYPSSQMELVWFYPDPAEKLKLPSEVPPGIRSEFREAEKCLGNECFRAAAGMFRSVLDKTLRDNGYKPEGNLQKQIDAAAEDGVITQPRKRRAHDEVRVLGNDVLHDEWREISKKDVEAAHHYMQRILEDLYDNRVEVEKLLHEAKRLSKRDRAR